MRLTRTEFPCCCASPGENAVRVVVVGSAGFIGGVLTVRLRNAGFEVVESSSRDGTGLDASTGLPSDGFPELLRDDCVLYMAQSPHYRSLPEAPWRLLALNAFGPAHVARRALEAGAARFVQMSTGNVYAPSFALLTEDAPVRRDSWYALSKLNGEDAVRFFSDELQVTVVRLFGVYGPGQARALVPNLARTIRARQAVSLQRNPGDPADCDGLRVSFCHVDDAVYALERLFTGGNAETVNVGGVEAVSIRQLEKRIALELDVDPVFDVVEKIRESDLIADTSKLASSIRWQPRSIDDGIAQTMPWLREAL